MKKKQMSIKTAYLALAVSIIFEQIGTGFLEACDAFTKLRPIIFLIIAYVISYYLFSKALKHINLSVSYATWTALGTISAALIGLIAFHQVISLMGWIAIAIMSAGIFILNLYGTPKEDLEAAEEKAGGTEE